jgi:hypothetical protein
MGKRFSAWLYRRWQPICDVCSARVTDEDPRCPHCGALYSIDVQIEMTDELAFYVRRTDSGLGTSDARWDNASGE